METGKATCAALRLLVAEIKTITIITEKFDLNWMFQNGHGLQHCNATGSVALRCL